MVAVLVPGMSWAGGAPPGPLPAAAPVLSEVGLIALGLGLLGVGGFALLRRRG